MRVKREHVLDFLMSRGYAPFTTTDIAEALQVKEYRVRAAVSWLRIGGFINFHAWHEHRDHVKVYVWTGKAGKIKTVRQNRDERQYKLGYEKFEEAGSAIQDVLNLIRKRT